VRVTRREPLGGTPEEVYALLTDPDFQEAKCRATTAGGGHSVDIAPGTSGARVRTERVLPSDGLPDVARSFVGEVLVVVEVQSWSAPEPDGARESAVDLHVKGAPLTLKGTLRLEPDGAGTVEVLEAELRANVPLIGGRIERAAAGPIDTAIDIETRMLREHLGG
jgi:hypothetical protein